MEKYLRETKMLDYSSENIQQLIRKRNWNDIEEFERLKSIYTFVRDEILFGYNIDDTVCASKVLTDGYGQCNTKGTLFMALLRVCNIPCRVHGFTIDKEAMDGTVAYLTICFIGIPFITAYNIISSIFRGMGDSKSPMYFIAVACAANISLDYLFMGILHLGAAGAALGTTLSQAISVAVSLTVILKRKSIVLKKDDFKPSRPIMGKILKIGVPIAFQDGLIQIAFIVITIIANQRGLNDAAAVGIVEKVIGFLFLIPSSMLSTVSALGAQNIGAGKPERATQTLRYAVLLAVGFGVISSIVIQFAAEPVVALFTDRNTVGGADVIRLGGQYLRGYIWDSIFAGIHFSFSGYFCACGKSGLSFLHNILAIALVRIPGVYLTSQLFPETLFPMGLATAAGSLLSVVICVIAFTVIRRKDWQLALRG